MVALSGASIVTVVVIVSFIPEVVYVADVITAAMLLFILFSSYFVGAAFVVFHSLRHDLLCCAPLKDQIVVLNY